MTGKRKSARQNEVNFEEQTPPAVEKPAGTSARTRTTKQNRRAVKQRTPPAVEKPAGSSTRTRTTNQNRKAVKQRTPPVVEIEPRLPSDAPVPPVSPAEEERTQQHGDVFVGRIPTAAEVESWLPPQHFAAIEEPSAGTEQETTAKQDGARLEGLTPAALGVDSWLPPERSDAFEDPGAELPRPAPDHTQPATERWLVAADLASLAVIGGLTFLNVAGTGGVLRVVLALVFVTWVPGWALVRAAGLGGGLTGIAVAVLASLTISAAASTGMVWLNMWHPILLAAVLGAASAATILWTLPPAFVAARLRG